MKKHMFDLKEETIGSLEKANILKKEAVAIKEEALRLKAKQAMLRRESAKHVVRQKFYVITTIVSWILLTLLIMY